MHMAPRIILLIIIVLAVYYFVYWVPFSLITIGEKYWIQNIVAAIAALVIGWFIWNSTKQGYPKGLASSVFTSAFIIGGIGFIGGFFGPIIFSPSSNQGPLLGIFITGPLGFLLGALGGLVYWLVTSRVQNKI